MSRAACAALCLILAGAVAAQPIVVTPLPPLDSPAETPPDSAPRKPAGPAWLPQGSASVQALDKVSAQSATLTIKVGQSVQFGSLRIVVKACVVRPPDQAADAAAYLDIVDSRDPAAGFAGWLVRSAPSVSMVQHPIYDLRVNGCGA